MILAAKNFSENLYDGDTLPATFEQMERMLNDLPILGIADRGYRGRKMVENIKVLIFKGRLNNAVAHREFGVGCIVLGRYYFGRPVRGKPLADSFISSLSRRDALRFFLRRHKYRLVARHAL